jgi:hypothetical protein
MIDGKFLVAKGHGAWKRKSDAVLAFKNSDCWKHLEEELKDLHPDEVEHWGRGHRTWKYGGRGKLLTDALYEKLLADGTVSYFEIKPAPGWIW